MPAAHDMGKSLSAAALACTWIEEHDIGDAFVVTTAPWDQARPRNGLFLRLASRRTRPRPFRLT